MKTTVNTHDQISVEYNNFPRITKKMLFYALSIYVYQNLCKLINQSSL